MLQSHLLRALTLRLPAEVLTRYGQAVQTIAGADGQLSAHERELLLADARWRGVPEPVVTAWREYDWRGADMSQVIAELRPLLSPVTARLVIYDALRVARADGHYRVEEREAVQKAGTLLGLPPDALRQIEELVTRELAVLDLQKSVLGDES
jgi:tellurite resistance protein